MSLKSRMSRAEDDLGGVRCDECMEKPEVLGVIHNPEACDGAEMEAGFPSIRGLIRAGWFAPNAPRHEHVRISDETRELLDSGQIVADQYGPAPSAVEEIARREPHLWRCKAGARGEEPKPCPVCGFEPDFFQIVHTHEAAQL